MNDLINELIEEQIKRYSTHLKLQGMLLGVPKDKIQDCIDRFTKQLRRRKR